MKILKMVHIKKKKTLCFNRICVHFIYPVLNIHLKISLFIWDKSFLKFLPCSNKYLDIPYSFFFPVNIILMFLLASVKPIEGKQRPQINLPKPVFLTCFKVKKFLG